MAPKITTLMKAAREARLRAQAPYSKFLVGAALETVEGLIVTGCNIESASYGLTMCAERVAVFKAISEGHRRFVRIAIVGQGDATIVPCGACRQILWEFCGNIEVYPLHVSTRKPPEPFYLADFFPLPYDAANLERNQADL